MAAPRHAIDAVPGAGEYGFREHLRGHAAPTEVPAVLTAAEPEPRTRIRVNHSRTQREGWQYESTVEIEYRGDGSDDDDARRLIRLAELLKAARGLGERERDARNAAEMAEGES